PEPAALATEGELLRREAARRRAPVEPRQVERIPALREEDVRVAARELVHEGAQEVLLGTLDRHLPETYRPDPTVRRRDAAPPLPDEMDLERRDAQRRGRVVDRLGRFGGPKRGGPAGHGSERVERVREMVELRRTEVDVVEGEPFVPSERIRAPGEGAARGVALRNDREDGPVATVEERRASGTERDRFDVGMVAQTAGEQGEVGSRPD